MITKNHYFFILSPRRWSVLRSLISFNIFFSIIIFFKFKLFNIFIFTLIFIFLTSIIWWLSYRKEFNIGKNSSYLEEGVKFSIILFISSEIFFFFSFFWSYFHLFLSPNIETGLNWPPTGVQSFDCLNVPLLNTLILLISGLTVTISHNFFLINKITYSKIFLFFTFILGVLFSILQGLEYLNSFFSITDGRYGTVFFVLTGFHGIHVLVGSIFLILVFIFSLNLKPSKKSFTRFDLASWYWHFVDVVWIFLYFFLYYLNN